LDSQRVRLLTTGYLRGWLSFEHKQKTSAVREEIILYRLEGEEYEDLLKERLRKDTVLVAGLNNKTDSLLKMIEDTYQLYLGLKLPELAKKLKIGVKQEISSQSLSDMRKILEDAKKKAALPK
jgi:glutamyl/glutaminyl-tRNA synthetase